MGQGRRRAPREARQARRPDGRLPRGRPRLHGLPQGALGADRLARTRSNGSTSEIKRRADVVGIFPNDEAIIRLVGALMLETIDEWAVSRRYLSLESLASLADTDPRRLPAWRPDQLGPEPRTGAPTPRPGARPSGSAISRAVAGAACTITPPCASRLTVFSSSSGRCFPLRTPLWVDSKRLPLPQGFRARGSRAAPTAARAAFHRHPAQPPGRAARPPTRSLPVLRQTPSQQAAKTFFVT